TEKIRTLYYGDMSPYQPARVASLSKAVTAVCIARLIDDGKLSFTTTLGTVLADTFVRFGEPIDPRFKSITIEQILTHRSGLARETTPRVTTGDMTDTFRRVLATRLGTAPMGEMSYSNVGYLTLGIAIEAASGEAYEEHCQRTTLARLGASGSIDPELRHRAPNGGWRISAVDYVKFAQVWNPRSKILGSRSPNWLETQTGPYGLGIYMYSFPGGTRYFHSGKVAHHDRGGAYYYKFETGWTVVVVFEGDTKQSRKELMAGLRQVFTGR